MIVVNAQGDCLWKQILSRLGVFSLWMVHMVELTYIITVNTYS